MYPGVVHGNWDNCPTTQAYLHENSRDDGAALREDTAHIQEIVCHHGGIIVGGVFLSPDSVSDAAAPQPDSATLFARVLRTLYAAYARECLTTEGLHADAAQRVFEVYQYQEAIFAVVERLHTGDFVPYDYKFVVGEDAQTNYQVEFLFVFVREERHSECYAELWAAASKAVPLDFYISSASLVAQWLRSTALEAFPGAEFLVQSEEFETPVVAGNVGVADGIQTRHGAPELWAHLVAVQSAAREFVRLRARGAADVS